MLALAAADFYGAVIRLCRWVYTLGLAMKTIHAKPPAWRMGFARPFQKFAAQETSGGILLLVCAIAALVWANSPWIGSYVLLWHTPLTLRLGPFVLSHDLRFWVNDGLMAIFFFVVGLEIKRELLVGELASPRQAILPILAALGGVLVPALLYTAINMHGPGARGWGIPMATDIAFAVGAMALLGDYVPFGLKVFLTALAIVDDIVAVLVIAVFYRSHLSWEALIAAGFCFLVLLAANRLGVRRPLPYVLIGIALWMAMLQSGVHATIAGVLLAIAIPSRTALNQGEFLRHGQAVLDQFERAAKVEPFEFLRDAEQQTAIESLEDACDGVRPPLHYLERRLHPWVTFAIMPAFALANAGVPLISNLGRAAREPIAYGVLLGLLLGKPIGITLASRLSVRVRLATLPRGVSWKHIHGAAWLGGIGFTMSLFMAALSFTDEAQLASAKLAIFAASLCAGIIGSILLVRVRA